MSGKVGITPSNLQLEQLKTIAEVSRAIASELNLDTLLQLVANLLSERFDYPFVHIFIVHPGRRWIEFRAGTGQYAAKLKPKELSFSLDSERGIIPWVAQNGQSALINNVYEDTYFEAISFSGIEIKSELTVPLIFGANVLGVFDLASEHFNAFTPHDQWLLETLADNVAIAIRNAKLYQSERWRRQAADSLRQIAGVVRVKETLDNTLVAILSQLATILPITFAAIWLKKQQGYQFKIGYQLNTSPPPGIIEQAWFDKVVASGSSLIRQTADQPSPMARDLPATHSAVGAVLAVDDNTLGVMILLHERPKRFGREAQQLLEIFAGQAAIVIENTALYHKAKEQAYISTALLQVAQTIVIPSSLSEVLGKVVRITPTLTGVSHCLVFLYDGKPHCTLAAAYGFKSVSVPLEIPLADFPILNSVISKETTHTFSNLDQLPEPLQNSFEQNEFQGLMLPLSVQNNVVGVLMVADHTPLPLLSSKRQEIVTGIAHQIALAIDNARLYQERSRKRQLERELQLAQEIQTSFIPDKLPALPGWELGAYWKMAREVGGDFFDVISMSDNKFLIIVADVADKGLPASLFMVRASSMVRAVTLELDQPAEILDRVNYLLCEDSEQSMFVSAFCAVIDAQTGQTDYASAGHNPPILVNRANETSELHAKGVVLGVTDNVEIEQKRLTLQPGDGIIFYTDGVTEAFNAHDEMFGQARFLSAIKQNWHLAAPEIAGQIYQEIHKFTYPHPQSDDFTLLLVRRME